MVVSNLAELTGKSVYTKNAKFVGTVEDAMLDTERGSVYGVVVQMDRSSFLYQMFEKSGDAKRAVLIPHKHVISAEDIILISMPKKYETPLSLPSHEEERVAENI
ncbi:PRC-barrel domain-containing protein [Candidatus Undinarchaeota archaeon]